MLLSKIKTFLPAIFAFAAVQAQAAVPIEVVRLDASKVEIRWADEDPMTIYVAGDATGDLKGASVVARNLRGGSFVADAPSGLRTYFILRDGGDNSTAIVAERELPLQKGSNFRDIGGYATGDGRRVKWGKVFRSGAMPLLTEQDYQLLSQLKLGTIVDLRSTDERQIAPDLLDDRIGALFVSNDYSLKALMSGMSSGDGEYIYRGIGKAIAPQYRAIFRRMLDDDQALLVHCSAGQDRTGVATALIYSALGVPRETILRDYHLSTALRRPQFEMPLLNPADWPGNPIIPFYVAAQKSPSGAKAEPLYSRKGHSHLAQFFELIDVEYGSVTDYLKSELGLSDADLGKLQAMYLDNR